MEISPYLSNDKTFYFETISEKEYKNSTKNSHICFNRFPKYQFPIFALSYTSFSPYIHIFFPGVYI